MKVTGGAHINTGLVPGQQRKDGGPKPFNRENIWLELIYKEGEGYKLRIADKANVEFHLDITITEEKLSEAKIEGLALAEARERKK